MDFPSEDLALGNAAKALQFGNTTPVTPFEVKNKKKRHIRDTGWERFTISELRSMKTRPYDLGVRVNV